MILNAAFITYVFTIYLKSEKNAFNVLKAITNVLKEYFSKILDSFPLVFSPEF